MSVACPPLSVAPMMQRTDRHFRFLIRQLSRRTLLYTEMVVMGAILRGERSRFLDFDAAEHPLALQIGGDDPTSLAECARIATDWGYDEINLNVGCPSDKVQSGNFGVCLMAQPERVAACIAAMKQATHLPVTVKHRIGFDDLDRYEDLSNFVEVVSGSGADRFTVHARKAWLQGLSPKENRTIPPLRYDEVYRVKAEHPSLAIELNGGAKTLADVEAHLEHVDGVMIGRGAWDRPGLFASADSRIFGTEDPSPAPEDLVAALVEYAARWLEAGPRHKVGTVVRPSLNLFAGQPGARQWRRILSERAFSNPAATAGPEVFWEAWEAMVSRGGRPQLAAR